MLGKPVAQKLKEEFKVRLLVRDPDKAKGLLGEDYDFVPGDLFDEYKLNNALSNVDGVHINLSGENEMEGVKAIVKAANSKNIRRISYISGSNVCEETLWFPIEKRKYDAEQEIIKSSIPYTIFRATWFMESLPLYVRGKRASMVGSNPKPFHFVAANDYANMVLTAYQKQEAANKILYIHGPDGWQFKQALEQYIKEIHPEIKKVGTVPYFVLNMMGILTGNKMLKHVVGLMKFFEKVGELGDPSEANQLLGAPKTTFEEWIEVQKEIRK